MPLIFRLVKGTPLTFLEGDDNLRYLEGLAISSLTNFSNWTGSASSQFAGTASLATTASYALNAGTTVNTGSLVSTASFNSFTASYNTGSFSGSFTGSFEGTASWANNALTSSNVEGGTQYYVPVWTGATTLGTSSLYESGSVLKTVNSGGDRGIKLDFTNSIYSLGDQDNSDVFIVDTGAGIYKTQIGGIDVGLKLDFANNEYSLGDSGSIGNGNKLIIDNLGGQITLSGNNNNQGLYVAHALSGRKTTIGDYSDTNNSTKIVVNDSDQTVIVSGSTILSGSLFVNNLTTGSTSDVLTYNTTTGQVFFTASSAVVPTPTLQQVTTAGNSINTDDEYIKFYDETGNDQLGFLASGGSEVLFKTGIGLSNYTIYRNGSFDKYINGIQNSIELPNEGGTLVLKVNGVSADASGSITIPTGSAIATGSFLTTGSLSTAQQLSGSLNITGSLNFFLGSTNATKIENGWVVLSQVSMSLNFANDAAAAAGGVPLGGLYRNGNAISIRIV